MALKASMRSAVITPPVGLFQGGYGARKQHSIGTHDDLHARCIALSDGATAAAALVADIVRIPKAVAKKTKELVAKATPIEPDRLLLAATHTHSGPGPGRTLPGFARAFDLYAELLPYHLAGLVYEAWSSVDDVDGLSLGRGESHLGHHRRTWDESTNYVDRELVVARLRGRECNGVLFNVGTHAVKMSPENVHYSADYPGFAIKAVERVIGGGARGMFFQGPCGNVNPWNQPFENPRTTFGDCEELGDLLAGDVLSALGKARDAIDVGGASGLSVRAGAKEVAIPEEPGLDPAARPDDVVRAKVYAIVLGDVLSIVGVPGEMFSRFGRMIKDSVKTKYCIVQEIAANELVEQDDIMYVPTREAFAARKEGLPPGGYEVMAAIQNPEAGYIICEAASSLVNTLLGT
ncbi:MAG: hypothetical protein JW839_06080 [Candidatus Lokiarchaeota archaeon]|nr:hypothetical protein [Candidatus Lokiarchaeota archaeon]